jgi:hypothetical protein
VLVLLLSRERLLVLFSQQKQQRKQQRKQHMQPAQEQQQGSESRLHLTHLQLQWGKRNDIVWVIWGAEAAIIGLI